jgi:MoxR-like ATPase
MVSPADFLDRLRNNIASVFLGKPDAIQWVLASLLAEGHVLIEDVPGIGKTLLARALASSLGCTFHRIQFTPDLLPSDIIGTTVFHQTNTEFVFKPGPLFAQVVLADEINRTTPRTQSALLEAMNDRQVSVDGNAWPLTPPFIVLATQNPYEFEGTYPLPESQLDRFLIRVRIGYPDREAEKEILLRHRTGEPIHQLRPVMAAAEVIALQNQVRQVRVDDQISEYILDLVEATRNQPEVYLGASTRAALSLYRAAQGLAVLEKRDYVVPDDVKCLAVPVLAHRLVTRTQRQREGKDAGEIIIEEILNQTPVPV